MPIPAPRGAAVRAAFAFDYRLNGHRLMVRCVDLDQPWARIHHDLLALVDGPPSDPAARSADLARRRRILPGDAGPA